MGYYLSCFYGQYLLEVGSLDIFVILQNLVVKLQQGYSHENLWRKQKPTLTTSFDRQGLTGFYTYLPNTNNGYQSQSQVHYGQ